MGQPPDRMPFLSTDVGSFAPVQLGAGARVAPRAAVPASVGRAPMEFPSRSAVAGGGVRRPGACRTGVPRQARPGHPVVCGCYQAMLPQYGVVWPRVLFTMQTRAPAPRPFQWNPVARLLSWAS